MSARPLIIDCDPGQDDAVALLLAFASPELDVRAVTAVAGNVPLDLTAANARRICQLAGRGDVPVHAGCARPLLVPLETAEHVHGESGLAGADLLEAAAANAPGHAVDVMIEHVLASPGAITIAALGPLTNLATAIDKEPGFAPAIGSIVLMGGAVEGGNVTPHAEFNVYVDPHAAAIVFDAGAPLTMIGLDVTRRAVATAARVAAIGAIGTPAAEAVAGMLSLHLDRGPGPTAEIGGLVHDACVTAYLVRPDLFTARSMAITVETTDPERRGKTVADTAGAPVNADVVLDIDADGFFALLTERLAALP
jgi:purine nucleosidase